VVIRSGYTLNSYLHSLIKKKAPKNRDFIVFWHTK
jgi:hypothetical protein